MKQRLVCWFSHGAASAVATKLTIDEFRNGKFGDVELIIATIFIEDEHEDNDRFLKECEHWFKHPVTILTNNKYKSSVDNVIMKTRYMRGPSGARCTKELKKQVRYDWQRDDDIHVFGFTSDEQHRIDDLIDTEPTALFHTPLIDNSYNKNQCFEILNQVNIKLPMMYLLGFHNNNCIGCLKASGAGYWNHIRKHFPDVFKKRAEQERMLGVALVTMSVRKFEKFWPEFYQYMKAEADNGFCHWKVMKNGQLRIPLRYLPPDAGTLKDLNIGSCGFICAIK